MPNTDFPKYIGLAGRLTDDNDDLNNDLFEGVTLLKSGPEYPAASQDLNTAFANIAARLDDENKPECGSELYIRMRDVAPLIQAVRALGRVEDPDWDLTEKLTVLRAHLNRLSDIPENALA